MPKIDLDKAEREAVANLEARPRLGVKASEDRATAAHRADGR